jgi:hypothetical protein
MSCGSTFQVTIAFKISPAIETRDSVVVWSGLWKEKYVCSSTGR